MFILSNTYTIQIQQTTFSMFTVQKEKKKRKKKKYKQQRRKGRVCLAVTSFALVFLFFSLSFTFTSILFNSIRYFWLPSVGNSIQNYRLLFSLFGFIHSLILISNLKKSDPKGKKEKKNNSSVLGMSYAYLFKYIIIGDTGTPPSLSLSNSNLVFVF